MAIFHLTQCYNKTKVTQYFALIPDQIVVEIDITLRVIDYQHGSRKIRA